MRQRFFQYSLFLYFAVALAGCINEIKFDESGQAPELVLNCLISPDSLVKSGFTYSRFFLLPDSDFVVARNLQVNMYINNSLKESLKLKGTNYVSVYRPKQGETVKFLVTDAVNKKTISASTVLPFTVKLDRVDSVSSFVLSSYLTHDTLTYNSIKRTDTLSLNKTYMFDFALKFNDLPSSGDCYRVAATLRQSYAGNKFVDKKLKLLPNDPAIDRVSGAAVFDANSDKNFNIFDDRLFNAGSYSLKLQAELVQLNFTPEKTIYTPANLPKIPLKTEIIFDLQAISNDLFLYLKTVKYNNTDLQYFSEPVQIYSNVLNGIGLLGSVTHSYQKMTLKVDSKSFFTQQ